MANDPYGLLASGLPPEIAADAQKISRQQLIAQALMQQSSQPLGMRPAGRMQAAPHWLEGAAKLAQAYAARRGLDSADQQSAALGQKYQQGLASEVQRIAAIRQGQVVAPDQQEYEQAADQGTPEPKMTTTGNPRAAVEAALASPYKTVQHMGALQHKTLENELTRSNDRDARLQERILTLDAAAQNAALSREDRAARGREAADLRRELITSQQTFAAQQNDANRALRSDMNDSNLALRRDALKSADAARQQKNTPKLPTPALKLQQEELDAIGTGASINADLGGIAKQIDEGKLELGLGSNVTGAVRNFLGASNENSRNLASFKATLEKLRNDSLRLNKGVQTEGDAVRAWNELVANINDKEVVKQRLSEVQKINERAVNLRKMNVDAIRGNYGLEPMDTTGYERQAPAVGSAGGPAVGTVQDGYRFKGGDPAKRESWEKAP